MNLNGIGVIIYCLLCMICLIIHVILSKIKKDKFIDKFVDTYINYAYNKAVKKHEQLMELWEREDNERNKDIKTSKK